MKKLFLLCAFVIAAMCTARLEAMDNEAAIEPRQTRVTQYFARVTRPGNNVVSGIPTPNLQALAAPNNFQDPIPQAPARNAMLPPLTWPVLRPNPQDEILRRLHE
jgi:hypothetical protein